MRDRPDCQPEGPEGGKSGRSMECVLLDDQAQQRQAQVTLGHSQSSAHCPWAVKKAMEDFSSVSQGGPSYPENSPVGKGGAQTV